MRKTVPIVPHRQLVTFRVGPIEFGLDVALVHEVVRYRSIAPVPRAPAFVEGMIELRGALIPVVDLRRRLEVAEPGHDDETRIMVADVAGERLGLVADRVTEVLRAPETSFSELPPYIRERSAEAVTAVVRLADRPILMLDLDRLLTSEERVALDELAAAVARMLDDEDALPPAEGTEGSAEPNPRSRPAQERAP